MLKSLNTESNTYLTPSLPILSVDNFLFPKISRKIEPKHRLLGASPPPARGLRPPRSRHARSPTRHPPTRPFRAALNGHANGVKSQSDDAFRIVSPSASSSPASAPLAPYGAPAPRSPDACNTRRTGKDHNLLKTHRHSDDLSAAHMSQHAFQTPQDGRTGVIMRGGWGYSVP
ncbi:Hypothetical protein APO_1280 [Acetobacter pomorum DM001]|uniref:Uncharacterized protein n=1 Tax=Acetobacter pomorum DM001 TaxID=945681 RepID=F1YTL4_9PROT|nr:Hypothetical protein APO_1280 [Acetobacter pomorum DM001]